MARHALVLGSGGPAASGWEIGVIFGLAEARVRVSNADVLVGTSAGARVAVRLASGQRLEALYNQETTPPNAPKSGTAFDPTKWREAYFEAKNSVIDPAAALKKLGALARLPVCRAADRRFAIERETGLDAWPDGDVRVVAVDAYTGERRAFTARDADMIDALEASGAMPGISPLVRIEDGCFMDGGTYSTANADVAFDCDRVLVLSLRDRDPSLALVSLDETLEVLKTRGAKVEVILPDKKMEAALAAVGGNVLDPRVRAAAARAGREQGKREAARVSTLWRTDEAHAHAS